MRAGTLISRIVFYGKVTARDTFSASVDTWPTPTITTRGQIREVGGSKTLDNEERFFSKYKELTVRYNASIVETMKVKIDGGTDRYLITYIEEIGRKKGMRISLEKDNQ